MKKFFVSDRRDRFLVSLILFLALFVFISPQPPRAQSQNPVSPLSGAEIHRHQTSEGPSSTEAIEDGYVIVNTKDGVVCRQMTRQEAGQLSFGKQHTGLRVLSGPRLNTQQQQGLKITLRATPQLDQFPEARQVFLRAAAKWESIIQSQITVIIDVDFGPTIFGTPFPSPSIIGGTDPQRLSVPDSYGALRATLIARAQNERQTEIFNLLPTANLPTDLGPTTSFGASSATLRALGAIAAVANPDAELIQLGPPPSIGFNSAFTFDFDSSDGIDSDKTDFEAVAIHEIGHALGFISGVGIKELTPFATTLTPTVWDLFRFRPGGLVGSSVTDSARLQLAGGDHVYFVGDAELPLSTSTNSGTGGDGRQSSHWKDNALIGTFTGVMDPTAGAGERLPITAADLTAMGFFGYRINPAATVAEVLSVDDGSREDAVTLANAIVVNRYTPARYPATLEAVRVQIPPPTDDFGQQLRIVAFVDANRTGQPPANPTLIVDRTITVQGIPGSRFVETLLSNPPVVNSGDLYVGFQSLTPSVLIAGDRNGRQQNRSFVSTNNGASFQPLRNASNAPLNFISRIVLTESVGSTASPALASLSPSALPPGSPAFTLNVQGSNFQLGSVVRWNGADRSTTLVNGTLLQAQIPAADVASAGTASITVLTSGGGESAAVPFNVTANRPVPVIARLTPNAQVVGATLPVNLSVFGVDFTPQSVIRYNGNDRATTFVSSTQVMTTLPPTDFAVNGDNKVTVFTPGPGGGTSSELNFAVNTCSFGLSASSQTFVSQLRSNPTASFLGGIVLNTASFCPWTVVSNAPWLTVTNPPVGAGAGKFVINYSVTPNTDPASRTTTVAIAGQTLNIRQLGRATSVSAASFAPALAAESIGAIFGVGLATETRIATSQPLPTNLNGTAVNVIDSLGFSRAAGLFFVSSGQINFLVPAGTANGNATVQVTINGNSIADGVIPITTTAPALFAANASGQGVAAAVVLRVKADGSQSFESATRFDTTTNSFVPVPIDFGAATDRIFLLLFGGGIRGRSALGAVSVKVGDVDAPVSFAGPAEGFSGLDQINAELSRSLIGRGPVTINLTVDGRAANAVTVTTK
jgi:uncharacterized protein (TIGR03437 family)